MRVLCIDGDEWISRKTGKAHTGPKAGEECVVIGDWNFPDGSCGYLLENYPAEAYYMKKFFIPLSDRDETEYAQGILEKITAPEKQLV